MAQYSRSIARIFRTTFYNRSCFSVRTAATAIAQTPIPQPPIDTTGRKVYGEHIERIVDAISQLTLTDVADLNRALKQRLNLPDAAPAMMSAPVAAPQATVPGSVDEVAPAAKVKTSFTVRLTAIDDKQKIAIIKEVKNIMTGMNLVQAKKFVETLPQTIKEDVGKDEADQLKKKLEAIGAKTEIA